MGSIDENYYAHTSYSVMKIINIWADVLSLFKYLLDRYNSNRQLCIMQKRLMATAGFAKRGNACCKLIISTNKNVENLLGG